MGDLEYYKIQQPTFDFFHKRGNNILLYVISVILIMFIIFPSAFIRDKTIDNKDIKYNFDIIPEENIAISLGSKDKIFDNIFSNEITLKEVVPVPLGVSAVDGINSSIPGTAPGITYITKDGTKAVNQSVNDAGEIVTSSVDVNEGDTAEEIASKVSSSTVSANANFKDILCTGTLSATGIVTEILSTNTTIKDSLIELNTGGSDVALASDIGIVMEGGTDTANLFMGWDKSATSFRLATTDATGASTGDLTLTDAALACGAITTTGNLAVTGTLTGDTSLTLDATTITTAEIGVLDSVTAGTAAASKALVLDSSSNIASIGTIGCGAITSTGVVTGTGFTIGNAAIVEAELEMIDGITAGTAAASKALVLDSSSNIASIGTIGCGAITSTGVVTGTGFTIGNAAIVEAELEMIDGITAGTAAASKALVLDSSSNIASIGTIGCGAITSTGVVTGTGFTIGNAAIVEAELEMIDGITAGTAAASKALVLDSSSNIASIGTIGCGAITSTGVVTGTGFTIGNAAIVEAELEMIDGITAGTAAASKALVLDSSSNIASIGTIGCGAITSTGVVTGTGFTIGNAAIVEAELEMIDGITAGTAAASKALVLDSSSNIASIGTIGCGAITTSGILTGNAGISVKNGATSAGFIDLYEDSDAGSSKIRLIAPALAADVTLTLPINDGDADQVLSTNGSGVLAWVAAASGGASSLNDLSDVLFSTGASSNLHIGDQPDSASSGAKNNVSIGLNSMTKLSSGDYNTVVGYASGNAINSGTGNCSLGSNSLQYCTTGFDNIAIGYQALEQGTSMSDNIAIGTKALKNTQTNNGGENIGIGYLAGQDITTGRYNTLLGYKSGNTNSNDLVDAMLNTLIGYETGGSDASAYNQTVIGASATGVANNSVTLGNASVTAVYMAQDSGATVHCAGVTASGLISANGGISHSLVTIAATDAITEAEHAGRTNLLGEVGGNAEVVLTLPDATGTGNVYKFIVSVVNTSNYKFVCPDADNTISGQIIITDADGTVPASFVTAATTDTIILNGTTSGGGAIGDYIELTDILANKWAVSGMVTCAAGSDIASMFSTTVS